MKSLKLPVLLLAMITMVGYASANNNHNNADEPPYSITVRSNLIIEKTDIAYSLNKTSQLTVEIQNAEGQTVRTIYRGTQVAGQYNTEWNGKNNDGKNCPEGIYFIRMTATGVGQSFTKSGQVVLLRSENTL